MFAILFVKNHKVKLVKKNILLIDNNDSFTYNLVGLIRECGGKAVVVNTADAGESICSGYDKIMLSPGPELPAHYPNMMNIIDCCHKSKDIFGICLGHQAIGEYFGMELVRLGFPVHGIKSKISILGQDYIFEGMPRTFEAGRYHSWVLANKENNSDIIVTSADEDGTIMSIAHRKYRLKGLQFHPESIMTELGRLIIGNWMRI